MNSATENQSDQVIAEGVDDEPMESNRRVFSGPRALVIAGLSALYAAFHMLALNGVSISEWTGVEIPFLPTFPIETFVPPHIHPTQDEYILLLDGTLDLVLGGKSLQASTGDLVSMPRGIPHGIFNNAGHDVTCMFSVTPTGKLVELFRKLHNMSLPSDVVAVSPDFDVNFLPPQRAADVLGLK